jgi:cold shock CspA family protein
MAKSQETFGKKEKSKQKLAKRKEKEEKAQERKANAKKGASLEDMMAYVDEHGNLSSTPSDPSIKRVFKQSEIVIGVAKQEEIDLTDVVRNGVVTFFNTEKGFGFIKIADSDESIFVHVNELAEVVKENDKVSFTTEKGPKGNVACGVKLVK